MLSSPGQRSVAPDATVHRAAPCTRRARRVRRLPTARATSAERPRGPRAPRAPAGGTPSPPPAAGPGPPRRSPASAPGREPTALPTRDSVQLIARSVARSGPPRIVLHQLDQNVGIANADPAGSVGTDGLRQRRRAGPGGTFHRPIQVRDPEGDSSSRHRTDANRWDADARADSGTRTARFGTRPGGRRATSRWMPREGRPCTIDASGPARRMVPPAGASRGRLGTNAESLAGGRR